MISRVILIIVVVRLLFLISICISIICACNTAITIGTMTILNAMLILVILRLLVSIIITKCNASISFNVYCIGCNIDASATVSRNVIISVTISTYAQ